MDDNLYIRKQPQSIQSNRLIIRLCNDGLSHHKTITQNWETENHRSRLLFTSPVLDLR